MSTAVEPKPPAPKTGEPTPETAQSEVSYTSTLKWEYVRMSLARPSFLAAQGSGVLTVVAIQHFDASIIPKSLIAAATPIGLIITPLVVNLIARSSMTVSRAIALMQMLAACFLLVAVFDNSLTGFMIGTLIGVPLLSAITPLITAMWRQMVPGTVRGKHFGRVVLVSAAIGLCVSYAISRYMDQDAGRYQPVIAVLAVFLFISSLFARHIPSRQISNTIHNPIFLLKILWEHKEFGYMSAAWMILGFSNLASIPLRVQYLASSDYGFQQYSPEAVLYLTLVIPQLLHVITTPVWGIVFDRINFILTRIGINTCFALSILLFFMPNIYCQVAGSVFMGIGMGGGMVAWSLWVTKYAPPDRTADYMAVHTFLTGCRGLAAPFFAFYVAESFSMYTVTYTSVVGVVLATLMIVPLIKQGSVRPKSVQTLEKPSDMVN